ncbi:MAG: twin-arginine translocase TatA/TatE family subunit [Planctomicrobium sp.]|jgi:sec-independent protein translocase protein TatA|nr:twin-arginine translocase TatA/TatE family subunit [Planctomicrobium sp.]
MFGLGTPELVILALIVLLLFGSRLPSAMKSLGMSVNSFKKGMNETDDDDPDRLDEKDE